MRGPVPYVQETFALTAKDGGTELAYSGEMGADFWSLGEWWADKVADQWERAVGASMGAVARGAERRGASERARRASGRLPSEGSEG